jgi:hypothetical protein
MSTVKSNALLRPLPEQFIPEEKIRVVCNFRTTTLVVVMCLRSLERLMGLAFLTRSPPACKWVICAKRNSKLTVKIPMDSSFDFKVLKEEGLRMIYSTAGCYYNSTDAEKELSNIPVRRGKNSAVVTEVEIPKDDEDDDDEVEQQSDDTEYDSDDQPKPKKAKPLLESKKKKKKKPKQKSKRKQIPENASYRDSIVCEQAKETQLKTFTFNRVGNELAFVFGQLLRAYTDKETFDGAEVFLYNEAFWLERLKAQALACGNKSIAEIVTAKLQTAR